MIYNIVAGFYFLYWIYYNQQPFSIWWLVLIYLGLYIFMGLITGIMKGSAKAIEKEGKDIKDVIKGFEKRLDKVKEKF